MFCQGERKQGRLSRQLALPRASWPSFNPSISQMKTVFLFCWPGKIPLLLSFAVWIPTGTFTVSKPQDQEIGEYNIFSKLVLVLKICEKVRRVRAEKKRGKEWESGNLGCEIKSSETSDWGCF